MQHYLWLALSVQLCSVPNKPRRVLLGAALVHPLAYLLIYFTPALHPLYIHSMRFVSNGYFPVWVTQKGPLYLLLVGSGSLLCLSCAGCYLYGWRKTPRMQRGIFPILFFAMILPWASVYLVAYGASPLGIDYYPMVSMVSGLLLAFGMFKYRVFSTLPIATEMVFRQSRDAIVIIDQKGYFIDVNDAFARLYPALGNLTGKQSLAAFLSRFPELAVLLDNNAKMPFQRDVDGAPHYYAAEFSPVGGHDKPTIGQIFTITDVTLFIEHEKQLEKLAAAASYRAEQSELSFLQAQIKPHFLNNTLGIIASMVTRNPDQAQTLIALLGEHLANCCYFDDMSPLVPLEKELESVTTYVCIEKARFRERLHFHLDCTDVPNAQIPRLALQPLVENAIRHGILKKPDGGNVWLTVRTANDRIRFEIRDDGVGMDQATLNVLPAGTIGRKNIGISNIHQRLLRYYGQGLRFASSPGAGTRVFFEIPWAATVTEEHADD